MQPLLEVAGSKIHEMYGNLEPETSNTGYLDPLRMGQLSTSSDAGLLSAGDLLRRRSGLGLQQRLAFWLQPTGLRIWSRELIRFTTGIGIWAARLHNSKHDIGDIYHILAYATRYMEHKPF